MGKTLTYAELDRASRNFAAWLQSQGLKRGARVAIMMPNVLQYPVAIAAVLRAGCTVVNVNPLYKPRELEFQLTDFGAEAIIVLENFASVLQAGAAENAGQACGGGQPGRHARLHQRYTGQSRRTHIKRMVPPYAMPTAIKFNDALAAGRDPFHARLDRARYIAFLQYTGGTTVLAKGAMLPHRNLVANMLQVEAWNQPMVDLPPKIDRLYCDRAAALSYLRPYGVFPARCPDRRHLPADSEPRDIRGLIRELSHYKVNMFPAVNTLYNALLNNPDFGKIDWSMLNPRSAAAWRSKNLLPMPG